VSSYSDHMNQTATYWAPGSNDGFGGVSYGAPVTFSCRWQDASVLFRDSSGREASSSSVVYTDSPVLNQGYLFQGTSVEVDPTEVTGAFEIRQNNKSPSLDGEEILHKVFL
jgi:hypothetical protein